MDRLRFPSAERQTSAICSIVWKEREPIGGEGAGEAYRVDMQHNIVRESRAQQADRLRGGACPSLSCGVERQSVVWYTRAMVAAKRGSRRLSVRTPSRVARVVRVDDDTLRQTLDDVRARCDVAARREADPVHFVHRYERREDREIVALLAASLAFGNVKALCAKIQDALNRLGSHIAETADDAADVHGRLAGFRHRLYSGKDVAHLVVGARAMQRAHGSLAAPFVQAMAMGKPFRSAVQAWVHELRDRGGFPAMGSRESLGADHLLPDPTKGSALKRLMLFLRWMIRPADGIDLGLWNISPAHLVIPLDTHIHKLSRNIGLTLRKAADFQAAEEITAALARLDADDPVKYDFSLCHLGMLQSCPSRKDIERCQGCGVKPICRHWVVLSKRR